MTRMGDLDIQGRLDALIAEFGVPGASAAIGRGEELVTAASGVANLGTGVEATPDTVFQIGSITKVYTATLVMQLVDEGKVELDAPIRRYLPHVHFGDRSVEDQLTVRQFLTHTSGLEGDYFEDFGRGDDGIARYAASLADLPQLHPPGENHSYCNAGWVLLGHLVEHLEGAPFHEVWAKKLAAPGGLSDTVVLTEEAIMRRVAIGHIPDPASADPDHPTMIPAPAWSLAPSSAPAGSLPCATAADVVKFAQIHMNDGQAADGTAVLSPASAKAMQQPQVELPDKVTIGDAWGLGWFLMSLGGKAVYGHDGGTIGQAAFLRVCPEEGLAVALLTNGGSPAGVYRALFDEVFRTFAGVGLRPLPEPLADPAGIDLSVYEGSFERYNFLVEVKAGDGELLVDLTISGPLASLQPPVKGLKLRPAGEGVFLGDMGRGAPTPFVFYRPDPEGRPAWLHFGARAHRRIV